MNKPLRVTQHIKLHGRPAVHSMLVLHMQCSARQQCSSLLRMSSTFVSGIWW
jgi:hypothetical protein